MKYRVQFLISANRLPDVVAAAFGGKLDYDPEMKIWPASKPGTHVLPGDVAGIERPVKQLPVALGKRSGNNKGNRRAEVLQAALKTGPKRWKELRAALSSADPPLSESSLNNLIGIWKKAGKISRSADGLWSLTDAPTQRADAG
jgi:hypothetical protein